jgi:hypothetical protein
MSTGGEGPAFLGHVYYVRASTGVPLSGWPPELPLKGFRGGFKGSAKEGQRQRRRRATTATTTSWGSLDIRGLSIPTAVGAAGDGSALSDAACTSTTADAVAGDRSELAAAAAAAERDGPSAYFTSLARAESWRDVLRRPRGLFQFPRRRLWRPSDVPLAPVGRVGTPGCQIGYMDHTGCHRLGFFPIRPTRVGCTHSRVSDHGPCLPSSSECVLTAK